LRTQGHRPELRRLGTGRGIQDLCDTEIQQLRDAVVADKDIPRLNVAMDDQVLVGVLHRSADLPKELQPRCDRKTTLIGVFIDGSAFDQLHNEVRNAIVCGPSIEQACDIRVIERGENLTLVTEALNDRCGIETASHKLDSDFLLVNPIDASGPVHFTHSAVTNFFQDLIHANAGSDSAGTSWRVRGRCSLFRAERRLIEKAGGRFLVMAQQCLDFAQYFAIVLARLRDVFRLRARLECNRAIKYFFNTLPSVGIHEFPATITADIRLKAILRLGHGWMAPPPYHHENGSVERLALRVGLRPSLAEQRSQAEVALTSS